MKLVDKIHRINPGLQLIGALLIRHDERQTVCKLIEASAREQIGKLINIRIPSSTKVNQSAIAQMSLHALDRSSKVAREFRRLAEYLAEYLDLLGSPKND
jgi:chromosome partitioning protein